MTPTHSIWQAPPAIAETANEANVEHDFIVPILAALGYDNEHIAPKHPVIFQAGRSGAAMKQISLYSTAMLENS